MSKYKFTCEFCKKPFVHESWYLKHRCKEMERHEQIETPLGKAGWEFYRLWLTKNRRTPRGINTFVSSKYYNAFIKFAQFVKSTGLPEHETFMRFVIMKNYDPHLWTDKRVYQAYLEFLDSQGDPLQRVASTIKFIQRYTYKIDCNFGDVFDHFTASELIHKVYSRELSPWLILNSPKFWDFYKNKVNPVDRVQIDGVIRVNFWKPRFAKHADAITDIKKIVKRLNL